MKMSLALLSSKSKHPNSLNVCKSPLFTRRRLCTTTPSDENNVVTQALHLLQLPEDEWDTTQLNALLFSSDTASSHLLFQITRSLPSSSKAFNFLQFLQQKSPSPDTHLLSSAFQAVLELARGERGGGRSLLELYDKSKEWGIPLAINSAVLLIRFFGRCGMLEESLALFNEFEMRNFQVYNALLYWLLKFDRVDVARKMLDEMFHPNAKPDSRPNFETENMVLVHFLRRERSRMSINEEEIVNWVLKFGECRIFPTSILMTRLITRLCKSRKTDAAWHLLNELLKLEAGIDTASFNALLTGLGRDGNFKRMNELTAKMKKLNIQPDVITFGILINHLCKFRRVDEALEVLEKMSRGVEGDGVLVEPDAIIYNTLIDGLCKVRRQEEGVSLLERMRLQKGFSPNVVTYNCLIDGFCKVGEIGRGEEFFKEMEKEMVAPNVITVNTLVDGMCRLGRTNSAVEFFDEMQGKGIKGDAVTYTIFINAFRIVNNLSKAMEYFEQMMRDGHSLDGMTYYTLISSLCQAGRMDDATFVVSKLKEAGFRPDVLCFNDLIGSFCSRMNVDKAYEILKEMKEVGQKPNEVTYNSFISYFSKEGDFKMARRLIREVIKEGQAPTVVTYGALIRAYCLHRNVKGALKVFKDMNKVRPNTVIYNILIESLCKNNDMETALFLMDDMKVKGVKPNATTYNALFKGLREKGWLKKAFELMDRMTEHNEPFGFIDGMYEQACHPDYITMEILTEWLSAVGETEKLKKFVQGYKVSASAT